MRWRPREIPRPWPNALRWAAVGFVGLLALHVAFFAWCVTGCMAGWPRPFFHLMLVGVVPAMAVLGWPSPKSWGSNWAVLVGASAVAALTWSLVVLLLRAWYLQLRRFLARPPEQGWKPSSQHAPGSAGSLIVAFGLVAVAGFFIQASEDGYSLETVRAYAVNMLLVAALLLLPLYFTMNRHRPPTRAEQVLAFLWLTLRRVAAALLVLLLLGAAAWALRGFTPGGILGALALLVLAGFVARWGWFGAGVAHSLADDHPVHEERKRRYRWD